MSSSIPVATWALLPTASAAAESCLDTSPFIQSGRSETVLDDKRTKVNAVDIKPGGKYYSIVKLQMKYEGQDKNDTRYAMGTGWLIAPDLLVTAGHCAYDHQYGFGRAIEVKAYVGYYGKQFVDTDQNVQFRQGVKIATTKGWIDSDVNRAYDVSFIRVQPAFEKIEQPVAWKTTPVTGNLKLGVVGYPADQESESHEKGAEMYEMFAQTYFNLQATPSNMLEYLISTYAGQSGSPVLLDGQRLISIGAHVYGLGNRNSASVIRGQYGNDFGAYISIFAADSKFKTITTTDGVTYLEVPPQAQEAELGEHAESFEDIFRKVVEIGDKVAPAILSAGTPFLGPQATKIAGAVATAFSVANALTKPKEPGTESGFEPPVNYKSHAARAVLAEATLQHVIHGTPTPNKVAIFNFMKKSYGESKTQIKPVTRKIGPYLLDPALRILVAETAPAKETEASFMRQYPRIGDARAIQKVSNEQKKAFVEALSKASVTAGGQEGFLDFLNPLASLAVNVVGTGIGSIAKAIGGSESSLADGPTPSETIQAHMETLCHRALMAEAALQAALEIPAPRHEEDFFGDLAKTVVNIGSTVVKVAPSVIKAVTPIVKSLAESSLQVKGRGEIDPMDKATIGGLIKSGKTIPPIAPTPNVPPAPSFADMAKAGTSFRVVEKSSTRGLDEVPALELQEEQQDGPWPPNMSPPTRNGTAHK